jgi:hypothetical protein
MNDHYENHNQTASNDQINLKKLTIGYPEHTLEITRENFKSYFKKQGENIQYRIISTEP